jgi:hypothetical protein
MNYKYPDTVECKICHKATTDYGDVNLCTRCLCNLPRNILDMVDTINKRISRELANKFMDMWIEGQQDV